MSYKICKICGNKKNIDEFRKSRNTCKECERKAIRLWRKNNKEHIKEYQKKYNSEHKEQIKAKIKEWRENNKEHIKEYNEKNRNKINEYSNEWSKKNRDKINEQRRKKYNENKEKYREISQKNYEKFKDKIKKRNKIYKEQNKEKYREYMKTYNEINKIKLRNDANERAKQRRRIDEKYRIKENTKCLIRQCFRKKGFLKSEKTEEILGIDLNNFYIYLLETYKKNYGYEWDGIEKVHIDHIKPISYAKTKEEIISYNNYKNLQLLREKDNLEKKNNIEWRLKNDNT